MFGTYMLRLDISSWWIVPFINVKWPSLSLLIDFSLKSMLSDMHIATPACLWGPFSWKTLFYPLTLSQCLVFSLSWVSYKQHMTGSCILFCFVFLTQFAILCLLIGALRPFTFRVNIERYLLLSAIFVSLLFSFTYSLFICLLAQKGLFYLSFPVSL
jgi:hypothetical protein